MSFHIPAHKNLKHPAGQYREPHPSRQTDENSKGYPTAPREPHPRTCFARILKQRIEDRS